jgi:hypothetical protein
MLQAASEEQSVCFFLTLPGCCQHTFMLAAQTSARLGFLIVLARTSARKQAAIGCYSKRLAS